eukprot:ANDGO_04746.mRNA.1 hypothetical protein
MPVACVLVGAASVQAVATPFQRRAENSLEIISLGILLVNLVCSVQSQVLAVEDVEGAGALVFLMNIGFSTVMLWRLLGHIRRKWRARRRPGGQEMLTESLLEENGSPPSNQTPEVPRDGL